MVIFLLLTFILVPSFFKKLIRSIISGSIAQLSIVVTPLACAAAKIAFSVAPTEILGNLNFAPLSPL